MMQLGRVLTEPQTPPIRALFVYNANPVAMTPDQNRILARPGARRSLHRRARAGADRHRALRRRAAAGDDDVRAARAAQVVRPLRPAVLRAGDRAGRRIADQPGAVRAPGARHGLRRAGAAGDGGRSCSPPRSTATATGSAAPTPTTCADARACRCAFAAAPRMLVQFGTDFPTTPSGTSRAAIRRRCGRCATVVAARRRTAGAAQPGLRSSTINSIFGEFNLSGRRLAMHPDDARGARPARRRAGARLQRARRGARAAAPAPATCARRRRRCPRACGARAR